MTRVRIGYDRADGRGEGGNVAMPFSVKTAGLLRSHYRPILHDRVTITRGRDQRRTRSFAASQSLLEFFFYERTYPMSYKCNRFIHFNL